MSNRKEQLNAIEPEYYTANDVARILRQPKKDKIYIMCRSGELKAFRFGRTWLISKKHFDMWLKAQIPD